MLHRKRRGHSWSRTIGRRLEKLGSGAVDETVGAFMGKGKRSESPRSSTGSDRLQRLG
jgi:hypothetical protein